MTPYGKKLSKVPRWNCPCCDSAPRRGLVRAGTAHLAALRALKKAARRQGKKQTEEGC